jgi:hypothetical protein
MEKEEGVINRRIEEIRNLTEELEDELEGKEEFDGTSEYGVGFNFIFGNRLNSKQPKGTVIVEVMDGDKDNPNIISIRLYPDGTYRVFRIS